jgi:hypothetical protein
VARKIIVPLLTIIGAVLFLNGLGIMNYPVFSYLKKLPLGNSFLSLANESYRHDLENQVREACGEAEGYQMERNQVIGDIAYFEEMLTMSATDEFESVDSDEEHEIFQKNLDQRYRVLRAIGDCDRLTKDYQDKYPE